ncbi:TRAP transporter substrate-binding protein, partial [Chloroflexota bacterium]
HGLVTGGTKDNVANAIKDLTWQYTDGQVLIEIYPLASLVPEYQEYDAVSTGIVDMTVSGDWVVQMTQPDWVITYLPFWWDGLEHEKLFLQHPDGAKKMLKELETDNIKGLAMLPSAGSKWCGIISKDYEMKTLRDIEGLKMRTLGGIFSRVYDHLGAASISIPAAEATSAYELGTVDIFVSSVDNLAHSRLWESSKYCLLTPTISAATYTWMMNMDKWDNLPADIQDIFINQIIPGVEEWCWKEVPNMDQADADFLTAKLITYIMTDDERIEIRDAVWPAIEDYWSPIDPDLLELGNSLRK